MNFLKTCARCKEVLLTLGGFYKSGVSRDGYTSYCRECIKIEMRAYHAKKSPEQRHVKNQADYKRRRLNPEKRAQQATAQRAWQQAHKEHLRKYNRERRKRGKVANPERTRMNNQISNNHARAKRLGLPSNFHYRDWLRVLEGFHKLCAFCGASSALLDLEHLDALGHGGANLPGNIVPACRPCNAQKWSKTLQQFCRDRDLNESLIRLRASQVLDTQSLLDTVLV